MGANPHANGGRLLVDLKLPDPHDFELPIESPGGSWCENTRPFGTFLRDVVFSLNADEKNFRIFSPDELTSNRLGDVLQVENSLLGRSLARYRRSSQPGRSGDGSAERAQLRRVAGSLYPDRPAWTLPHLRVICHGRRIDNREHSKWLQEAAALPWREPILLLAQHPASTFGATITTGSATRVPG
ncbi:MAG: hypothetical protein M9947_07640 [Thermomicrobiales bacterium]|nr:hypothetical protein [Thermomicrobiales bacterium]